MKLEHFLFTFYINCNTKRSSANIFPRAAHYVSKSRMWLASCGFGHPWSIPSFWNYWGKSRVFSTGITCNKSNEPGSSPKHEAGVLTTWPWLLHVTRCSRFTPGGISHICHITGSLVGPRLCLDVMAKKKSPSPVGNPTQIHHPEGSHYTNLAIVSSPSPSYHP
jgi:hypothetical protein